MEARSSRTRWRNRRRKVVSVEALWSVKRTQFTLERHPVRMHVSKQDTSLAAIGNAQGGPGVHEKKRRGAGTGTVCWMERGGWDFFPRRLRVTVTTPSASLGAGPLRRQLTIREAPALAAGTAAALTRRALVIGFLYDRRRHGCSS